MKSKIFSMFILVGLLAFAKPISAQYFQDQFVSFDVYYAGSEIVYDHYGVYARVITSDGHIGQESLIAILPFDAFPNSQTITGYLQVWVPELLQTDYYRIGVAIVGMDINNNPVAVLATGASEWCDSGELNSSLLIKTN